MSHFAVLVVGDDVDGQLAPYHEYECTGHNDEYVVDQDVTEDRRAEYATDTIRRLRAPDGTIHDPYDPAFQRPLTEEERKDRPFTSEGATTRFVPDGYEEIALPVSEVMTFLEFVRRDYDEERVLQHDETPETEGEEAAHRWGYIQLDENGDVAKVVRRTNPNAQWDWYVIGGRWTGFFKMKEGVASGRVGRPGLFTEAAAPGRADQARKGDIDFEGMRNQAGVDAAAAYDRVAAVLSQHPPLRTWDEVRNDFGKDGERTDEQLKEARTAYWQQDGIKALREARLEAFDMDQYAVDRETYITRARNASVMTYGLVMNGEWYSRGKMGWFGMSHDDKPDEEWDAQYHALLDGLSDDTLLTVVDCHI